MALEVLPVPGEPWAIQDDGSGAAPGSLWCSEVLVPFAFQEGSCTFSPKQLAP